MDLAQPFITMERLADVEAVGKGLEFFVLKAKSEKHGQVALRVPHRKVFDENVNDLANDAKGLIDQELKIYGLLLGGPVPVPKPFGLLEVDDYPAMLSEYVADDGSEAPPEEVGRLAALIHTTRLPQGWDVNLVAMEGSDALTTLIQRILRRFDHLEKEEPSAKEWIPARNVLQPIAENLRRLPSCLLHMDLRDANLRVRNGKAVAVLDWTNALIGPAAADFFRIIELSRPGDAFIKAYSSIKPLPEVTSEEEVFLRLDAALMLALVFISEAPDPQRKGAEYQACGGAGPKFTGLKEPRSLWLLLAQVTSLTFKETHNGNSLVETLLVLWRPKIIIAKSRLPRFNLWIPKEVSRWLVIPWHEDRPLESSLIPSSVGFGEISVLFDSRQN